MKITTDYYRNFAELREIKFTDDDPNIEVEFKLPSYFKPGDEVKIWFNEIGEVRFRLASSMEKELGG